MPKKTMFIYVSYKDAPELSIRRSSIEIVDTSVEKSLLVNPDCPVRIMLEYIRKKCHLGKFTQFDLCDDSGVLKGLFALDTYAYATDQFEHKKIYYVIVIVITQEADKRLIVLPQLNQENKLYSELQMKVQRHLMISESSAMLMKKSITAAAAAAAASPTKVSPVAASVKSTTTSAKGSVKKK